MKFIILLACALAGAMVVADPNEFITGMGLSEDDAKQCYQDSGFSPDDAEKWNEMKEDEITEAEAQVIREKLGCFLMCINEKSLVTVNGEVQVDRMTEIIENFVNGTSKVEIREKVVNCKEETNPKDPCGSALGLMMCMEAAFKDSQKK